MACRIATNTHIYDICNEHIICVRHQFDSSDAIPARIDAFLGRQNDAVGIRKAMRIYILFFFLYTKQYSFAHRAISTMGIICSADVFFLSIPHIITRSSLNDCVIRYTVDRVHGGSNSTACLLTPVITAYFSAYLFIQFSPRNAQPATTAEN